jgi:hypothetical protein
MENPVDGTDGKLGRGFMSADKLEEVDIGNGDKPRPTFISADLQPDFRGKLIELLKEQRLLRLGLFGDAWIGSFYRRASVANQIWFQTI